MATIDFSKKLKTIKPIPAQPAVSDKRYHSTRWRTLRKQHLAMFPLCQDCLAEKKTASATVVDHHIPVRQGADFWDQSNWRSLCAVHHNIKRQKERGTINYANEQSK